MALPKNTKIDVPARPLSIPIATPAIHVKGRWLTAFLYGDTHHGEHCQKTLDTVLAIGKDLQPDILIDMGDGVDASMLSDKFKYDPTSKVTLQDEIDAKRIQLAQFRDAMPNADYYYNEGNHEQRMTRAIWSTEGVARQMMTIKGVRNQLTWPVLLGLDELHITWREYKQQTNNLILPKFIIKHGTLVRTKAGYSAHAELAKYGRSGASGHTHRLSGIYRRDHKGQHLWVETGCCRTLNPEYTDDPDWQNGAVNLTFDTKTGAVQPELAEMRNGSCLFRGQFYK